MGGGTGDACGGAAAEVLIMEGVASIVPWDNKGLGSLNIPSDAIVLRCW